MNLICKWFVASEMQDIWLPSLFHVAICPSLCATVSALLVNFTNAYMQFTRRLQCFVVMNLMPAYWSANSTKICFNKAGWILVPSGQSYDVFGKFIDIQKT